MFTIKELLIKTFLDTKERKEPLLSFERKKERKHIQKEIYSLPHPEVSSMKTNFSRKILQIKVVDLYI